jgi:CHAD domain-containing protein
MTENPSAYAIDEILSRINIMVREIPGVMSSEDPECLHRMRVATRRLRAAMGLLSGEAGIVGGKDFFKLVRSVTKRLGEARDLDVQVLWLCEFEKSCRKNERPGVERLILRLTQSRSKKQPAIVRLLSELDEGRILSDTIKSLQIARLGIDMAGGESGGDVERATRVIGLQIESLIQHSVSLSSPEAADAQHRMRIETKRLRYAMEVYRMLYVDTESLDGYISVVKKLQSILGELHDADLWITRIPELMEREKKLTTRYFGTPRNFGRLAAGYNAVIRDRTAFRASQYELASEFWSSTVKDNAWGGLRSLILAAYRDGAGLSGV